MKLESEKRYIESNGLEDQSTAAFSMATDAVGQALLFEMLRSKIYTNPILAVLREYCSNAKDAQLTVCPERPIEVHLPTSEELYFSVKDHGVGMDKETVMKLYSTYGESTKRDDGQAIGGLGLGCKSAFSAADTFTITSCYNGVKMAYVAFIDKTNLGQITVLDEVETDEVNGVEIKIPVKRIDVTYFRDVFSSLTRYWKVQPACNVDIVREWNKVVESNPFDVYQWFLTDESGIGLTLLVGEIPYEMNFYTLRNHMGWKADNFRGLLESPICVEVPINNVSVAANRESLQFNAKTIETITKALEVVHNSIYSKIQSKVDEMATYLDAVELIYSELRSNFREAHLSYTWRGAKVEPGLRVDKERFKKMSYVGSRKKTVGVEVIYPSKSIPLLINDLGKPRAFDMNEFFNKFLVSKLFYLYLSPGETYESLVEEHFKLGPEWFSPILLSSYYVPPEKQPVVRKPRVAKDKTKIKVYKLVSIRNIKSIYKCCDEIEVPLDEPQIWFEVEKKTKDNDGLKALSLGSIPRISFYNLDNIRAVLHPTPVCGVRSEDVSKLPSSWKHLRVALNEKIERDYLAHANIAGTPVEEYLGIFVRKGQMFNAASGYYVLQNFSNHRYNELVNKLGKKHSVCKLFSYSRDVYSKSPELKRAIEDVRYYTLKDSSEFAEEMPTLYNSVDTKYPLLISSISNGSPSIELIVEYINLVDSVNV